MAEVKAPDENVKESGVVEHRLSKVQYNLAVCAAQRFEAAVREAEADRNLIMSALLEELEGAHGAGSLVRTGDWLYYAVPK